MRPRSCFDSRIRIVDVRRVVCVLESVRISAPSSCTRLITYTIFSDLISAHLRGAIKPEMVLSTALLGFLLWLPGVSNFQESLKAIAANSN